MNSISLTEKIISLYFIQNNWKKNPFFKKFSFINYIPSLLSKKTVELDFNSLIILVKKNIFHNLKNVEGIVIYQNHQLITSFDGKDLPNNFLKIIRHSYFPREHAIIKIKTKFENIYFSKIIRGNTTGGISQKEIEKNIKRFEFKIKKIGDQIKEISLIHTHPYIDYILNGDDLILHPLSPADIDVGKSLFNKFGYDIAVMAITPTKLSYLVSFTSSFINSNPVISR